MTGRLERLLPAAAIAVPLLTWWLFLRLPPLGALPDAFSGGSTFPPAPLAMQRGSIGPIPDPGRPPRITNVQIIDFDEDGMPDVLACDDVRDSVLWYRQSPRGTWTEHEITGEVKDPARATVMDLDGDGDRDVVVAVLGNLRPDDSHVGSIVLLERRAGTYVRRVLLDGVRRVADVQAGDFDGDGDLDLAAAIFGYAHGRVVWLENRGAEGFVSHDLHHGPGAIHVPVADYDGDGDPDIATVCSQDDEEVWAFENLGRGRFQKRLLWFTYNHDIGSAGLVKADLDRDGDVDLVLPVGDNFENDHTYPQPYHGCLWLENRGSWEFETKRIATFGGTYAADVGDLDGDGDLDVVLASMFNEWRKPGNACLVWLENDGAQRFTTWQLDTDPTHLVTVACGDLDGDGRADIVAGGLHVFAPWNRLGRITSWTGR